MCLFYAKWYDMFVNFMGIRNFTLKNILPFTLIVRRKNGYYYS